MKKSKLRIIVIFYICFLSMDCMVSNIPFLDARKESIFSDNDIFLSMIDRGSGYFGITEYLVIYVIVITLAIEYMTIKEEENLIIRYKSRTRYYIDKLLCCFTNVTFFTMLHSMIMIVFLICSFHDKEIINTKLFKFILLDFLIMTIFYFRVGIVYVIMKDLSNNKLVAIVVTVGIYFAEYNIYRFDIAGTSNALFCSDVTVAFEVVYNGMNLVIAISTVTKEIGMTLILAFIGQMIEKKRDVLCIET